MNKIEINIPDGIKFISELKNYNIPSGHVIVDKGICGCGYTHFCLTNSEPLILCSPRKLLLENKMDQIEGLYYFQNDKEAIIEYDRPIGETSDTLSTEVLTNIEQQEKENYIIKLKTQLYDWILRKINPTDNLYGPPKILVTYDSLPHVLDVINKTSINFQVVVDEAQSIFTDSSFKSEVELDFVEYLQNIPNVCYLSATPMMEKYLNRLDYFKDLPYYVLNWPKSITTTIKVNRKFTNSLVSSCKEIIGYYKSGNFPKYIDRHQKEYYSTEVVFFVNSVKLICDIIRKTGLKPEETNIICAKSINNFKKIKKLGIGFDYGRISKRDEPNKMFTFCTKTAYLGADFYSTCASTIVCSNINIETLTLDISLDLPQIMGRQRLSSNPFKNECLLLYTGKTKKDTEITLEEFQKNIEDKIANSDSLLSLFFKGTNSEKDSYLQKLQRDSKLYQYDYVGISKKNGIPVKNYLVQISELRAWEISRPEYQSTIMIKNELCDDNYEINNIDKNIINTGFPIEINQLLNTITELNQFNINMKSICNFIFNYPDLFNNYYNQLSVLIPNKYLNYINLLGPERIRANSYQEAELIKEINNNQIIYSIKNIIQSSFAVNNNYLLSDIKTTLQQIYNTTNIQKTAKASDLENWFEIKKVTVNNNGKRENGYKILKFK